MKKTNSSLILLSIILLLNIIVSANIAAAANDPGHDVLYIEQTGDSELTGNLNISQQLKVSNLFYSAYLDIQGNGSQPTSSYAQLYTANTGGNLIINAPTSLYLLKDSGSTVYIGGTGVALNVSGALYIQSTTAQVAGQDICLENGTNCPSALGGANVTGTGTQNYVTKWTGTSTIGNSKITDDGTIVAVDTSDLVVNTSSGNVGIGTSAPTGAKLVIAQPTNPDAAIKLYAGTGAHGLQIVGRSDHLGYLQFFKNDGSTVEGSIYGADGRITMSDSSNTDVLTIKSGYVGIGTTEPGKALEISQAGSDFDQIKLTQFPAASAYGRGGIVVGHGKSSEEPVQIFAAYIRDPDVADESRLLIGGGVATQNAIKEVEFFTAANSNTLSGTSRMFISSAGNVGIGMTSPTAKLHVNGSVNVTSGNDICIDGGNCLSNTGTGDGDLTDVLNGTGIIVTNSGGPQPSVAVNTTYLDANYVGQTEYPNLDTNSTNDLTTASSWTGGDLGGTGLAATVTDDSHAHTQTTITIAGQNITSGTISSARLPTSGITAGIFGSATTVPAITVDTYGRITAATNTSIAIGASQINNDLSCTDIGTNLTNTCVASAINASDLICTDCIGTTEISDSYLLNTGDTATGNYTFDTTTLHIDSTNDRVGIGTTSPAADLDVAGFIKAEAGLNNNLIRDPQFNDMAVWSGEAGNTQIITQLPTGEYVQTMQINSSTDTQVYSDYIPVDPEKTYRFQLWVSSNDTSTGNHYFGLKCYDQTKTAVNCTTSAGADTSNPYFWSGDLTTADTYMLLTGYLFPYGSVSWTNPSDTASSNFAMDSDVVYVRMRFLHYPGGTVYVSTNFALPRVEEVQDSSIWSIKTTAATNYVILNPAYNVGIGTTGPDAPLDVLSTTGAQLRLTYTDGSVYSNFTTDSSGDLNIRASGGDVIIIIG